MNGKTMLVFLTVVSLLCAGLVIADDFGACKKELLLKVVDNNPKAGNISFEQGTQKNKSNTEILYEGTGSFVRQSGEKEHLTWQCTVDKGVVKDAQYTVTSDAEISADMVNACESAIRDRIHNENQGSGAVKFETSRKSQLANNSKLLEGNGHVVIKGKDTNFDYQCTFDAKGALTDKKYEIK